METFAEQFKNLLIRHGVDKYPRINKDGSVSYSIYNPIKRTRRLSTADSSEVNRVITEVYS